MNLQKSNNQSNQVHSEGQPEASSQIPVGNPEETLENFQEVNNKIQDIHQRVFSVPSASITQNFAMKSHSLSGEDGYDYLNFQPMFSPSNQYILNVLNQTWKYIVQVRRISEGSIENDPFVQFEIEGHEPQFFFTPDSRFLLCIHQHVRIEVYDLQSVSDQLAPKVTEHGLIWKWDYRDSNSSIYSDAIFPSSQHYYYHDSLFGKEVKGRICFVVLSLKHDCIHKGQGPEVLQISLIETGSVRT